MFTYLQPRCQIHQTGVQVLVEGQYILPQKEDFNNFRIASRILSGQQTQAFAVELVPGCNILLVSNGVNLEFCNRVFRTCRPTELNLGASSSSGGSSCIGCSLLNAQCTALVWRALNSGHGHFWQSLSFSPAWYPWCCSELLSRVK